jgi:hypothetical protein
MRNNGVTNFPDPHVVVNTPTHVAISVMVNPSITGSPAFKAAQKACRGFLPAPQNTAQQQAMQRARKQGLLAFAKCIRGHGIADFPDPTSDGRITTQMLTAAKIDVHSPAVLTAARSCIGASNGAVTAADIASAANGQH